MQSLGAWFSGGVDSVRLMVGFDELEGLLQHRRFYDSNYRSHLHELQQFFNGFMLLRSNTSASVSSIFSYFHACHQFLVKFLFVTSSFHIPVPAREYNTHTYKVASHILPCRKAIFSWEICIHLFYLWTSRHTIWMLPSRWGLSGYSCVSVQPCCSAPLLLLVRRWQLPAPSVQAIPFPGLVCQENIGHSPANVVQCLGWDIMVSVLMGLALRAGRLKKIWPEK